MSSQLRLEQTVKRFIESKRPIITTSDNQGPTRKMAQISIGKQHIKIPVQINSQKQTQLGSFR